MMAIPNMRISGSFELGGEAEMAKARLATRGESFREQHAMVTTLLKRGWETQLALGLALKQIRDGKSYRDGGHQTFKAYVESLRGPAVRTAYNWIEVAEAVPVAILKALDPERIEPAMKLLGRPGESVPVTLKNIRAIEVPVVRDGRARRVTFEEATTEELWKALDAAEKAALPPIRPEDRKIVDDTNALLGRGAGKLGDARMRRRGSEQLLVIELPLARAREFLDRYRGRGR